MENSCPICLEQGTTELLPKCDCKYEYHLECLTKWLENGKTCPTCRQDLSEKADTLDTSDRVLLIDSTSSSYSNVITYIITRLICIILILLLGWSGLCIYIGNIYKLPPIGPDFFLSLFLLCFIGSVMLCCITTVCFIR